MLLLVVIFTIMLTSNYIWNIEIQEENNLELSKRKSKLI